VAVSLCSRQACYNCSVSASGQPLGLQPSIALSFIGELLSSDRHPWLAHGVLVMIILCSRIQNGFCVKPGSQALGSIVNLRDAHAEEHADWHGL